MKRVKLEFLDDIRSKKCASTGISSKVLALIDSHQCGCVKDMKLIIAKKYVRKSMQKHIDLYINGFLLCDFEPEPFSFIQEESDVIEVRRATMTFAVASNSNYSAGIEISDITSDATNISVSAASVDKKRKLPSEVRDRESRKRDMKQAGHLNFHQEEIAVVCVDNTSTGNNSVSTSSASSSSTGEAGRSNTTLTSSSSSSIIAGAADLGNGVSDPLFMWNQLQLQASVTKGSTPSAVAEKASSSGRKKTRRRRKSVAALVATASAPVAAVGDCVEVQCKDNNCGASDATSTTGRLHSNSVRNDTDKPPLPPGRPPPLPVTSSRSRVCVSETSRPALSLSPTAEDMQSPFRSYLNRDWNRHDCLASDQPCIDSSSDAVGAFNSAGTTTTCASAYHSAGHVAACPSLTLFPIQLESGDKIAVRQVSLCPKTITPVVTSHYLMGHVTSSTSCGNNDGIDWVHTCNLKCEGSKLSPQCTCICNASACTGNITATHLLWTDIVELKILESQRYGWTIETEEVHAEDSKETNIENRRKQLLTMYDL